MTPRFILLTFASCIIVFAAIWAATAPKAVPVTTAVAAPPVLYADCEAVRAAGAAPLRADQPGYRPALDGNMNGVACEPIATPAPTGDAGSTDEAPPPDDPSPDPSIDPDAPTGVDAQPNPDTPAESPPEAPPEAAPEA